ncbi:MAG: hypothetical protein RMK90_15780, partial [Acetobacteraceae bacterium]|nr:hypothetical protein [Acetobacteraceae bacterium]
MSGLLFALRPRGVAEALARALRGALGVPLGLSEPPGLLELPPPPEGDALLARLALGGALPEPLLAFGLEAALAALPATGAVLLFDAEAEARARFGPEPPRAVRLALRAALRGGGPVVALDAPSRRFAAGFGVAAERIEAPPLAPPAALAPLRPSGVLLIDHGVPPALRVAAAEAAAALGPPPAMLSAGEGDAFGPARLAAAVHVHLGPPRDAPLGLRLRDSFACRRPVVVLAPEAEAAAAPGVEALVVPDAEGLAAALGRLATDPHLPGILVRGAGRAAQAASGRAAAGLAALL